VQARVPQVAVQQQEEVRPPLGRPLGRSVPLLASAFRP